MNGLSGGIGGLATQDNAGAMSAAAASELFGEPPTDSTEAFSTAGAATYQEGSGTCTSTLDGLTLHFSYCYCVEHAALPGAVLVTHVEAAGFNQPASSFDTTHKRRLASYVSSRDGVPRSLFVVAADPRGRGATSGTVDYNRDSYDRLDIARAAAAIAEGLGATVLGSGESFGIGGYSTGGTDVQGAIAHLTDHVIYGVSYFPNWSLIQYWQLSQSTRAALTTSIGALGTSQPTEVDPYLARAGEYAISKILAMPGAPAFFLLGDRTDAPLTPIPSPDELAALITETPGARSRVHVHITQAGDSNRITHAGGVDSAGAIYAERYWVRYALEVAAEWNLPSSGDLVVTGWVKSRGRTGATDPRDNREAFEIWTAPSAVDCKTDSTGGSLHALDLHYDFSGRFAFSPRTSQNGKIEVRSRWNLRRLAFTAGTPFTVDLNAAPSLSADTAGLIELDPAHLYSTADPLTITGTLTVTGWDDQPRSGLTAFNLGASGGHEPATATDADGKLCIEFTAANSDRMTTANLIADPTATEGFTVVGVISKVGAGELFALGLATTAGSNKARINYGYANGLDQAYYYQDDGSSGIANLNGLGGHTFTTSSAKHFFAIGSRTEQDGITYLYVTLDGSALFKSAIVDPLSFTMSSVLTVIGAGYAPGSSSPYLFWDGRYYLLAAYDRAMSWPELEAVRNNAKTTFTF